MLLDYKNEILENQIILLESYLHIECVAYSLEFNPCETMFLEVSQLENKEFVGYLCDEIRCLKFCINPLQETLFYEKYVWNFLMYDFFDIFTKYKRNKFLYFYENNLE